MSDSDDDTVVQVHPTARRPGYDPPIEYVQFLDAGGELVKLPSLKDEKKIKAAVKTQKALKISELSILIDKTGKADPVERDRIDDMSPGSYSMRRSTVALVTLPFESSSIGVTPDAALR